MQFIDYSCIFLLKTRTEMNKFVVLFAIIASVVVTGCISTKTNTSATEKQSKVSIQAFIDGSELIYIKGNRICIQHLSGRVMVGKNIPISINGTDKWHPTWNKALSEEHEFPKEAKSLPLKGEWNESNMKIDIKTTGFGETEVITYPSAKNDHIMAIKIDDNMVDGPHWYFIDIDWE